MATFDYRRPAPARPNRFWFALPLIPFVPLLILFWGAMKGVLS